MLVSRGRSNIAYQFHQYLWSPSGTVEKRLEYYRNVSQRLQAPVINGEFGVDRASNIAALREKYESYAAGFDGWFLWTWKSTRPPGKEWHGIPADELKLGITLIQPPASWQRVINWISKKGTAEKPTRKEVLQGMKDFIEAVKVQNTEEDRELLNALFGE